MFLYQKFKYNYKHLEKEEDLDAFIKSMNESEYKYVGFDTETSGLNIIVDKPFLMSFGYNKELITFDYNKDWVDKLLLNLKGKIIFAHNAKFDYHMLWNGGNKIPDDIKVMDTMTVARLTEYADSVGRISLEALGQKYVDDNSKFAGRVIKKLLSEENIRRRNKLKDLIINNFPEEGLFVKTKEGKIKGTKKLTDLVNNTSKDIVQFVNDKEPINLFFKENYKEPTYEDVYTLEPELMRSYAADDIVIMFEYLNKSWDALKHVDIDLKVMKRESELIPTVAEYEKVGFKIDIPYMLESRNKLKEYRDLLYFELEMYTGELFTVGQHEYIKRLLLNKYNIKTEKADDKALKYIKKYGEGEVVDVVNIIMELRTIDKWLSTYIDGKLNKIINGRLHTDINNNGAVSGRVSSDMQQQPKDGLYDREGNELFHPRKMVINDEGHRLFFIDQSQMEMRVQADFTFTAGKPDVNLVRAFIPYEQDPTTWKATDLHVETARNAFTYLEGKSDDDIKHNYKAERSKGKTTNFLKVYQGGVGALMDLLDIDKETAEALDKGFYKAFPNLKNYQNWVNRNAGLYGYVENLYGRRYYMNESKWFYKLSNYLIQGTCADMMKQIQIDIRKFLKDNNYKTQMVLPVHDEIIFSVPFGEEHIVKDLQRIMQDVGHIVKNIPMVAEIEYTETNWKEKKEWVG